jgi:hypothetical protein
MMNSSAIALFSFLKLTKLCVADGTVDVAENQTMADQLMVWNDVLAFAVQ